MNATSRFCLRLAALLVLGLAAASRADGPPVATDDLGLTVEQKTKSAAIIQERKPALTAALKAAAAARREVLRRGYEDPPDEAVVRAASQKAARAEEELAVERMRLTAALRALLTPAQKRKLARAQEDVLSAMEIRSEREGALLDAWIQDHGMRAAEKK